MSHTLFHVKLIWPESEPVKTPEGTAWSQTILFTFAYTFLQTQKDQM